MGSCRWHGRARCARLVGSMSMSMSMSSASFIHSLAAARTPRPHVPLSAKRDVLQSLDRVFVIVCICVCDGRRASSFRQEAVGGRWRSEADTQQGRNAACRGRWRRRRRRRRRRRSTMAHVCQRQEHTTQDGIPWTTRLDWRYAFSCLVRDRAGRRS